MSNLIPVERIENQIFVIRGHKVMLDFDLAKLYGVETRVVNQAVKRNIDRFPSDFMFQLTNSEFKKLQLIYPTILKSQFVTSRLDEKMSISRSQFVTLKWGGARKLPFAFTEQGIAMLSSVLRSRPAIQINIMIMRAFVNMRKALLSHKKLSAKIADLALKYDHHDAEIELIFEAINKLIIEEEKPPKKMGFLVE
jgi:hypothetical protein